MIWPIPLSEDKEDKRNRAIDLLMESLHKPDDSIRAAAHDQSCYHELFEVRDDVLHYLHTMRRGTNKDLHS